MKYFQKEIMQSETICTVADQFNAETLIPVEFLYCDQLHHQNTNDRIRQSHSQDALSIVELGKQLLANAAEGKTEFVRDLMCRGAPFTTDWLGTSALHFAAQKNRLETAEVLLRAGISRDARTKVDRTPLHMAAYEGHHEMALLLLKYGADVDSRDMLKMTPLHWAVERNHVEVMHILLDHGADPNAISKFDKTPISLALEHDRLDLVDILQQGRSISNIGSDDNLIHSEELEEATHSLMKMEAEKQREYQYVQQQQQQQFPQNKRKLFQVHQTLKKPKMVLQQVGISSASNLNGDNDNNFDNGDNDNNNNTDNDNNIDSNNEDDDEDDDDDDNNVNDDEIVDVDDEEDEGDENDDVEEDEANNGNISDNDNSNSYGGDVNKMNHDIEVCEDTTARINSIEDNTLKYNKFIRFGNLEQPLRLLQAHGITMIPIDTDSSIVESAMESGRTVVLTEAGKMALNSTRNQNIGLKRIQISSPLSISEQLPEDNLPILTAPRGPNILKKNVTENKSDKLFSSIPTGSKNMNIEIRQSIPSLSKKQIKILPVKKSKAPVIIRLDDEIERVTENSNCINKNIIKPAMDIAMLNKKLIEAKQLAAEYRKQLQLKEEEAEIYKQQLKNIARQKPTK